MNAMSAHPDWTPLAGSPGFYYDEDGTLHVDEDEAIRGLGYKPTEQSRHNLRQAAADLASQLDVPLELC